MTSASRGSERSWLGRSSWTPERPCWSGSALLPGVLPARRQSSSSRSTARTSTSSASTGPRWTTGSRKTSRSTSITVDDGQPDEQDRCEHRRQPRAAQRAASGSRGERRRYGQPRHPRPQRAGEPVLRRAPSTSCPVQSIEHRQPRPPRQALYLEVHPNWSPNVLLVNGATRVTSTLPQIPPRSPSAS